MCVYETEKIKVLVESERRKKPDSKISQTRADKSGSKQHQRQTDQWQVHAEWQIEKLASVGKLATENRRQMCVCARQSRNRKTKICERATSTLTANVGN